MRSGSSRQDSGLTRIENMNATEIRAWLGLPPGARMRDPAWWARVQAGMADVPPPDGTSYRQLIIFRAYLACARPLPELYHARAGLPDRDLTDRNTVM